MSKIITVIYGSSTGNTEHAAQAIAGKLGGRAVNIRNASAADFQADLLILGTVAATGKLFGTEEILFQVDPRLDARGQGFDLAGFSGIRTAIDLLQRKLNHESGPLPSVTVEARLIRVPDQCIIA